MTTARFTQVTEPGASFTLVERPLPEPGGGEVRVTVEAAGVCHTDYYFVNGGYPVEWPAVFGHEIAGRIEALGEGVTGWSVGDRVEIGWFGGHCGHCEACRAGDFIHCAEVKTPGFDYPGGFADVTVVPAAALARIPEGFWAPDAAPMGCAGVATFNALRNSSARPGDLVAVLGVGGLGRLGIQFAAKMGFEVVAIARGRGKEELARELGAHRYIDSTSASSVAEQLQALGGAQVVLATAANSAATSATVDGLKYNGELLVVGATPEPLEVSPFQLIAPTRSVHGHPSGTAKDVEDTLRFAALTGIRPLTEQLPLEQINDGYQRMLSGEARFRVVLTTGK